MDSLLVIVVVFVITGISGWLQKKAQAAAEAEKRDPNRSAPPDQPQGPPPVAPPAQTVAKELETRLRRWMQEEFSPETAPPVVRADIPRTPPPPLVSPRAPSRAPEQLSVTGHAKALDTHLRETEHIRQQAEELQRTAQQYLKNSRKPRVKSIDRSVRVKENGASKEIVSAVSMLRKPGTVRQALIASFILASPKALDE